MACFPRDHDAWGPHPVDVGSRAASRSAASRPPKQPLSSPVRHIPAAAALDWGDTLVSPGHRRTLDDYMRT